VIPVHAFPEGPGLAHATPLGPWGPWGGRGEGALDEGPDEDEAR